MTRRTCLLGALSLGGCAVLPRSMRAGSARRTQITLTLDPSSPEVAVPPDFTGLGYELSSVARPGLLSTRNETYRRLIQQLGGRGVLRLGGIVADFSSYVPDGTSAHDPKHTVITRANLLELRGLLDQTGWTAIWSVNFGTGSPLDAIQEALAVHEVLGPRLHALELGNEVDNYGRGAHPLRKPPYAFGDFRTEYAQWHRAINAVAPGIRFAAPDAAGDSGWLEAMAASAHGDVQLLTQHYYRGDQRKATLDQLLLPDPDLAAQLGRLRAASQRAGIPWRMCETSSFFGGGHPGISDTLAGALWTLDFMLLLAQNGCAGVNLETGFNQLGFLSSYSPIRNDEEGNASVGAPYYGMLAFEHTFVAGSQMHAARLAPAQPGVTAYACTSPRRGKAAVLINRTAVPLLLKLNGVHGPCRLLRLEGPSIEAQVGLRFGGSSVGALGEWSPEPSVARRLRPGRPVEVDPYSAVVVQYALA